MFTNSKISKKDNVASKKELNAVKDEVEALKAADHFIKVDALPEAAEADKKAIYLVPVTDEEEGNHFTEHLVCDGVWEQVGSTKVDLSEYGKVESLTPSASAPAVAKISTEANTFFVMPVDVVIAEGQTKTINIMTSTNTPLA